MDWVRDFYSKQNEWFGVYLGDVDKTHRQRARLVSDWLNKPQADILELGAGGGQTSIALAELQHRVAMIELLPESAAHAQHLAEKYDLPLQIIQDDFYTTPLNHIFDAVCYFDSFGIGSDDDQRRLLTRIAHWLRPDGCAIIEIGATWYWSSVAHGRTMDLGDGMRRYTFDALQCRLLDAWWRKNEPSNIFTQSLRCYTPADIRLLLQHTGLQLVDIQAGGYVDYNTMTFYESCEQLSECMTYYILVKKIS